jgi:hypothetical protein
MDNDQITKALSQAHSAVWNGDQRTWRMWAKRFLKAVRSISLSLFQLLVGKLSPTADDAELVDRRRVSMCLADNISRRMPDTVVNAIDRACGDDAAAVWSVLHEWYATLSQKMVRSLKRRVTRAAQLPNSGDVLQEISAVTEANAMLELIGQEESDSTVRNTLLEILPPKMAVWREMVEERVSTVDPTRVLNAVELEKEIRGKLNEAAAVSGDTHALLAAATVDERREAALAILADVDSDAYAAAATATAGSQRERCTKCHGYHPTAQCRGTIQCWTCGGPHHADMCNLKHKLQQFRASRGKGG